MLDYSDRQLASEEMVAKREGYDIEIVKADMTKTFPFADEIFISLMRPRHVWFMDFRTIR